MCNGPVHRSLNGLVDPFSTFHLLRTYNRLVGPVDLAQYYNLAVIKDAKDRSHLFPGTSSKAIISPLHGGSIHQSPTQHHRNIDNCINHRFFSNPSPNRIVSSTCPSTPPPASLSATDDAGGGADTNADTPTGYLSRGDASSVESFQCILNRRQRGEKRPIPDEQKDDKYFERRKRNNEAAKKSRDARKMREDRIAFRAAVLEQENAILRTQMVALREEVTTLRQMICTRGSASVLPINVN